MPLGDPFVTFRFLLDHGFIEACIRRARIAWTCPTESVTDRELLNRVFDTDSPGPGWRMLCNWFLPKTLSEKSKWKRFFNNLEMERKEGPMKFFERA